MKKRTALLAVVCALILSGCANGNNSGQNIPSTPETSQPQASEDPSQDALSQYLFKCSDENGNPVSGVRLQVCTDESCSMLVSADDGTAVFDGDPFAYSIHVSAPEGYEIISEKEFTTLAEYSEYSVELKSI